MPQTLTKRMWVERRKKGGAKNERKKTKRKSKPIDRMTERSKERMIVWLNDRMMDKSNDWNEWKKNRKIGWPKMNERLWMVKVNERVL